MLLFALIWKQRFEFVWQIASALEKKVGLLNLKKIKLVRMTIKSIYQKKIFFNYILSINSLVQVSASF